MASCVPTPEEFVRSSLDRLRRKLLDLTTRNPLLSFKHSARSRRFIRLIDELPDQIYQKFQGGTSLRFVCLPDGQRDPEDERSVHFRRALQQAKLEDEEYRAQLDALGDELGEKALSELEAELRARVRTQLGMPPRKTVVITPSEVANELGLNPSFDLPLPTEGDVHKRYADNTIQTLMFREQMERTLGTIRDEARTSLEEAGVNTLHAAIGYLEWYESDSSAKAHFAPLILFPLEMRRELVRGQYEYSVAGLDEGPQANITLGERLRRDFGIVLPELGEEEPPESYFQRVADAVRTQATWKVRRWITVGPFSFARLAMYQDLSPDLWPPEGGIEQHDGIRRVLVGADQEPGTPSYAQDRDIDAPADSLSRPVLVTDADSSQVSAIMDVLDGRHLVIEGPPGTGKSQTITNIIAAALAEGKTVLFVAEKMAALNVVKDRLDHMKVGPEASLGSFCLEMHSTKARRRDTIDALRRRDNLRPSQHAALQLANAVTEAYRLRNQLTAFVVALNSPVGSMQLTVQQIIWGLERLRQEHPELPGSLDELELSDAEEWTTVRSASAKAHLAAFAEQQQVVSSKYGSAPGSPWFGLAHADLDVFAAEDVVRKIRELLKAAQTFSSLDAELSQCCATDQHATIAGLVCVGRQLETLRTPDSAACLDAIPLLQSEATREAVRRFLVDAGTLRQARHVIDSALVTSAATAGAREGDLRAVAARAHALGLGPLPVSDLERALVEATAQRERWRLAHECVELLRSRCEMEQDAPAATLRATLQAVKAATSLPQELIPSREAALLERQASERLTRLQLECTTLRDERVRLAQSFRIDRVGDAAALETMARHLRSAGIFGFLKSSVRRAKQEHAALSTEARRTPAAIAARELEDLADHVRRAGAFQTSEEAKSALGAMFRGLDSDFARALAVAQWGDYVRQGIGSGTDASVRLRRRLFECDADEFELIRGIHRHAGFRILAEAMQDATAHVDSEAALRAAEARAAALADLKSLTDRMGLAPQIRLEQCVGVADAVASAEVAEAAISANTTVSTTFGPLGFTRDAPLLGLDAALAFATSVAGASLPEKVVLWTLDRDHAHRVGQLREIGRRIGEAAQQLEEIERALKERGACIQDWLRSPKIAETSPSDLRLCCEECLNDPQGVHVLSDLRRLLKEVNELGLGPLVELLGRERVSFAHLPAALDRALFQSLARRAVAAHGALRQFTGTSFEAARKRFRELDRELQQLHRRKLAEDLLRRDIPRGSSFGAKGTWTDLALIRSETTKKTRHIPLRSLLDRAGDAIQAMMPCFMMSPPSVAQYLRPGRLTFDLVIMDEASQMRPEDALGAIARGGQVVVVGDPKQLPPTSFFQMEDSVDEDAATAADDESILDAAMSILQPVRRLKWHYRSRHGSLIAFSNKEFYDSDLIVFPSPQDATADAGVRYEHVPDGCYRNRVNLPEARVVAARAIDFMLRYPSRSLGIVTLNQPQQEAISLEIDRLVAMTPGVAEYLKQWEGSLEPFFVKNLENVQGDERDSIFISTVYGRDEKGALFQRFGPINTAAGHRRLNVLFTRAKFQTVVFSSMQPGDIRVDEHSSRGVRALHGFLKYALDRSLETPVYSDRPPDSDFEVAVASRLRQAGFEVVPQVGVAGYFIDLGIRHPQHPGLFVLGVECDGATYHSAKSARDRDRLRQEVLERLGWAIHRIWSLDWYRQPQEELDRLLKRLRSEVERHATARALAITAGPEGMSLQGGSVAPEAAPGEGKPATAAPEEYANRSGLRHE